MKEDTLTKLIIGCAMKVHSGLGPGFLESVYQKALTHELGKAGLQSKSGQPITVHYDGVNVGDFIADMLVEGQVLLELKGCLALSPTHEVQLVNYLTATGIEIGYCSTLEPTVCNSNGRPELTAPKLHRKTSLCNNIVFFDRINRMDRIFRRIPIPIL